MFGLADRVVEFLIETCPNHIKQSILWNEPRFLVRTTCSGAGAPEEALSQIVAACKRVREQDANEFPKFEIHSCSVCDNNKDCRTLLEGRHKKDTCIFGDLLNFLPKRDRDAIDKLHETNEEPFEEMKKIISTSQIKPNAPCWQHPLKPCQRQEAHIEIAGTHCQPWSQVGDKRKQNDPRSVLVLLWAKIVLEDKIPIVIQIGYAVPLILRRVHRGSVPGDTSDLSGA